MKRWAERVFVVACVAASAVAACGDDGSQSSSGASGAGGDGPGATTTSTGTGPDPWSAGCGDVVSCGFFFDKVAGVPECLATNCAAEIAACGTDGAECDDATRCGDDLIAADYASGCFDQAALNTWFCYFDRFECRMLRVKQPAARDFLQCALQCMPVGNCDGFPKPCSVVPPEPACIECLDTQGCLDGYQGAPLCTNDCYLTQVPCIESCRQGVCADIGTCTSQCTSDGQPTAELIGVYDCLQANCATDCCAP